MKERIIVVPSSIDLAKTLAYHNKALFNTRIFTPVELAQESLMRSGSLSDKEFISRNEELAYYLKIIGSISYFKTSKLSDLRSINSTINTIRSLIKNDEEKQIKDKLSKGVFKQKNDALYEIYTKYIEALNNENKIDTIGLIRQAITNKYVFDSEICYIKQYPLSSLDIELINSVSHNSKEITIFDLYEIKENKIHINSYKNCYGVSNEVGTIIDDIYKNHKPDESVIACADYNSYSQTIFDYALKYNIPVGFGEGLSIINSYPGKLLKQYYYWMSDGNFGWEPFFKLIYSPYFDYELLSSQVKNNTSEFWDVVSKLRLSNDSEINNQTIKDFKHSISRKDINDNERLEKYVEDIEYISNELALPIEEFLNKYSKIRNNNELLIQLDTSAKSIINNEILMLKNIGLEISDDVIETILKKKASRQAQKPGKIYVTSIKKATSVLRNNIYICGLSANLYPGSPIENPLLLDGDLKAFDNDDITSVGKIREKRDNLFDLIKLACGIGNNVELSYSGLNVSELKNNNASSLLFEIYKLENGDNKSLDDFRNNIHNVAYFDPELSISRLVGEAYNKSLDIEYKPNYSNNDNKTVLTLNRYSPSALNIFFNCRKQFFYQYLLKIQTEDDYNPYEIISATAQGTLAHSLMEYLSDNPMSKDEFLKLSETVFDEYMKISVPLIKEDISKTREEFILMLENGYNFDEKYKRKLAFKEEDKDCVHKESGICIHGYPDRVELDENGKVVIIDFKTERKRGNHIKDDIDTCLQVVIYAYIVENTMDYKIDHCEYRILRFDDGIVTCKYDDEIKQQLTEKLLEFKHCLETGDFSIEPFSADEEKERCKYCKFGSICGKIVTE